MVTRNNAAPPPRLLGAKRASAEFGIAYTTLRDMVHRGDLPFLRIGRAMFFERRDIEQWIASRKERGAS